MDLIEQVNINKLAYIVSNRQLFESQIANINPNYDPFAVASEYLQRLIQDDSNKSLGTMLVHYKQKNKIGRRFAGLHALQHIPREIRGTITQGIYDDIDIKNCHCVILQMMCKLANIKCDSLDHYVANREQCLHDVCDIDEYTRTNAKKIYLKVLNGGCDDYNAIISPTTFMEGFKNEMVAIRDAICQYYETEYELFVEEKMKENKTYNLKSKFMNRKICVYEDDILMHIWQFAGMPMECSLQFDGIQLRADTFDVAGCERYLHNKYPLVDIQLVKKPMECWSLPDEIPNYELKLVRDKFNVQDGDEMVTVNEKYCSLDFMSEFKSIFIKSGTGTGKTYNLIENMKRHPDKNVLYLSARKSQLNTMRNEKHNDTRLFSHYGSVDFMKARRSKQAPKNLLIQIESVGKLNKELIQQYDILIIDEFNSIVEQMESPNFVNVRHAMNNLCLLFRKTPKLVALDGYLNPDYVDLMRQYRQGPVMIYDNMRQNKTHETMVIVSDLNVMHKKIVDHAVDGKTIVIATDSKQQSEIVHKLLLPIFSSDTIKLLNGETSGFSDNIKMLDDINNEIKQYKAFIYSPSITSGVSIDVKHFDVQFNIFTHNRCSINSNLQMMNRARSKNDNVSYIYSNRDQVAIRTVDEQYEYLENRACSMEFTNLIDIAIVPYGDFNRIIRDHPIVNMIVSQNVINSKMNNDFKYVFLRSLREQGYKVIIDDSLANTDNLSSAIINDIKSEKYERISQSEASYFGDETVVESLEDQAAVDKYFIKKVYKVDDIMITPEFVERYGSYDKRHRFMQRIELFKCGNDSANIDQYFKEINDVVNQNRDDDVNCNSQFREMSKNKNSLQKRTLAASIMVQLLDSHTHGSLIGISNLEIPRDNLTDLIKSIKLPPIPFVRAAFGIRASAKNIKDIQNMVEYTNHSFRSALSFINSILVKMYDMSVIAKNKRCKKYIVKINGYIPLNIEQFAAQYDNMS